MVGYIWNRVSYLWISKVECRPDRCLLQSLFHSDTNICAYPRTIHSGALWCMTECMFSTSSVMQLNRLMASYPCGVRTWSRRSRPHFIICTESTVFMATLPWGPFRDAGRFWNSFLISTSSSAAALNNGQLTLLPVEEAKACTDGVSHEQKKHGRSFQSHLKNLQFSLRWLAFWCNLFVSHKHKLCGQTPRKHQ